jgi:hypothetical protein
LTIYFRLDKSPANEGIKRSRVVHRLKQESSKKIYWFREDIREPQTPPPIRLRFSRPASSIRQKIWAAIAKRAGLRKPAAVHFEENRPIGQKNSFSMAEVENITEYLEKCTGVQRFVQPPEPDHL